jgi:hypothetical protein
MTQANHNVTTLPLGKPARSSQPIPRAFAGPPSATAWRSARPPRSQLLLAAMALSRSRAATSKAYALGMAMGANFIATESLSLSAAVARATHNATRDDHGRGTGSRAGPSRRFCRPQGGTRFSGRPRPTGLRPRRPVNQVAGLLEVDTDSERAICWLIALHGLMLRPVWRRPRRAASVRSQRLAGQHSMDMFVGLDARWRNPQHCHDPKNDKSEQDFKNSIAVQESDSAPAKLRIIDAH